MADPYRDRISKDYLMFAAGHFICLPGSPCERLHGHNYRVGLELEGKLADGGVVCDFGLLKWKRVLSDGRSLPTTASSFR